MRLKRKPQEHAPHGAEQTAGEQPATGQSSSGQAAGERATGAPARGDRSATVPTQRGEDVTRRQEQELGGFRIGAAFFGWLVAMGLMVLLAGLLAAIAAAFGATFDVSAGQAQGAAAAIGIGTGIALLIVYLVAYFGGGYVAGRLARFKGARQGLGTWIIGLLVTLLVLGIGAIFGSQYNVFEQAQLPSIPSGATAGGIIWLALILIGTLVAAMLGGKAGQRYHRKIDRTPI